MRASEWSHRRGWLGVPDDIFEARQFVADHLGGHGLGYVVDDARLLVSELATNAVAHARTSFRVTLTRYDGHVRITVADGSPMPATSPWPSAAHGRGGRGLMIVDHLSDDWGVTTMVGGGKGVWATLAV
jgi:anti-sigma regulatory factor (Ser/Thr protein kinase)